MKRTMENMIKSIAKGNDIDLPMEIKKKMYLDRLKDWEYELETNKNNMKQYAERAIRLLKLDIERLWP